MCKINLIRLGDIIMKIFGKKVVLIGDGFVGLSYVFVMVM